MIIVMDTNASAEAIDRVTREIEKMGSQPHLSRGKFRTVIGAVGEEGTLDQNHLASLDGVEKVVPIMKPYKLASREFHEDDSIVEVGGGSVPKVKIGGHHAACIAGPCAVENEQMLNTIARHVRDGGATILRGGVYKPRTSPYSFQGLGEEGLKMLARAREETGLKVITEVVTPGDVELVARYADILQIGTRNMQNYALLQEAGRVGHPVMLKRGMSSTIEEWLLAAEYLLSQGNRNVMLCERGIRTFEPATRFTLDINAVPLVRELSHLPVIVDPSQGTGRWSLVSPLSLAAVAAGANGLIVEVHPHPDDALSDGAQSLDFATFDRLAADLKRLTGALSAAAAKN